jgi:hypothetical protein
VSRRSHPPRHGGAGEGLAAPPINHAATVEARAREAAAHVNAPPAGFAADPAAWLAELEAAQFTAEQRAYLWNPTALAQYEAGQATAHDPLAARIVAAWRAWLAANPAPPPGNPFDLPPRP